MTARGEDVGIKSVKDLKVYSLAFELAMEIFKMIQKLIFFCYLAPVIRHPSSVIRHPSSVFCPLTSGN
jgi:hypothetical protein